MNTGILMLVLPGYALWYGEISIPEMLCQFDDAAHIDISRLRSTQFQFQGISPLLQTILSLEEGQDQEQADEPD